jgi:hypothetical protein
MYYVYELIDPRVNLPFYVGKGTGNRVYFHLSEQSRVKSDNERKFNKIQKIRKDGYEPEIKIVKYFDNEEDAYNYEEVLIKQYGRIRYDENGILTNICENLRPPNSKGRTYKVIYGDKWEEEIEKRRKLQIEAGGYGPKEHTEETKRKISEKSAGKNNPSYGVPCSEERKRKIREKAKERYENGFKSPSSVTYSLISPEGEIFEVFGGLEKFCENNNICYATMCAAIKYDRRGPRRNGWSIEKKI